MASSTPEDFQKELMMQLASLRQEVGGLRSALNKQPAEGDSSTPTDSSVDKPSKTASGSAPNKEAAQDGKVSSEAKPVPPPGARRNEALKQLDVQAMLGAELQKLARDLDRTRDEMNSIRESMSEITGAVTDVRKDRVRGPRKTQSPSRGGSSPSKKNIQFADGTKPPASDRGTTSRSSGRIDPRKPHEAVRNIGDLDKPEVRASIERDMAALGVHDPNFIESIKEEYAARRRGKGGAGGKKGAPFSDMSYDRFNLDDVIDENNKPIDIRVKIVIFLALLSTFFLVVFPAMNRRLDTIRHGGGQAPSDGSPMGTTPLPNTPPGEL